MKGLEENLFEDRVASLKTAFYGLVFAELTYNANFNENTVVETLPSCNSLSPKIGSSINTLLWGALLFLSAAPLLELLLLRSPKILRRFCLADLYLVNCANWFIPFGRALEEYFA